VHLVGFIIGKKNYHDARSSERQNQFMLYGAEVVVCSKINTKQINTVWAECQFLRFKTVNHLANHMA